MKKRCSKCHNWMFFSRKKNGQNDVSSRNSSDTLHNDREIFFWKFKTPITVNLDVTKFNPV